MLAIRSLLNACLTVAVVAAGVRASAPPKRPVDKNARPSPIESRDHVPESPQSRLAKAKLEQQKAAAIQMEILRQRQANFNVTIREINRMQAEHHELMKEIIRNFGPTGRYEYNPATGRYDRYVPYR
jgi:hypothetical protein